MATKRKAFRIQTCRVPSRRCLADISMPMLNGIEAAALVRSAGLSVKVVFLTMHRDVAYARRAMAAGAVGFVLKHSVSSELVTAIRSGIISNE